ncbi:FixH family protein [Methylobacterium sp. JK268]
MTERRDLLPEDDDLGRRGSGRGRWTLLGLAFAAALAGAAGAGYALGQGAWTLPRAVTERVPPALAGWLPPAAGLAGQSRELGDYVFELAEPEARPGAATLAVRLVHRPTGKPVPDAVVFARRLDMAPEGMPTMTSKLEPLPTNEPGLHRFRANLAMEGGWRLSLAAKVQGEVGTVQGRLALKAVP